VDALEPTLVISTDLLGNDLILGIVDSADVDPSVVPAPEALRPDVRAIAARLAATGAEVFLANVPRPTLLPIAWEKRQRAIDRSREGAIAAGLDPDEAEATTAADLDAKLAELDALGDAYNAVLAEELAPYPNLHVVDLHRRVELLVATGLDVGGQRLEVKKFGGLLSTDGVHFGDVGYGMLADLFGDAIEAELRVEVPPVDLAALLAEDPYSPTAARAAGGGRGPGRVRDRRAVTAGPISDRSAPCS
jgi:hypothetical protein